MHNELQLPNINDTVLQSMYCIIELTVSYQSNNVYIGCPTEEVYERVLTKVLRDYQNDNYILAASKHWYNTDNNELNILQGHNKEQIILTL